MPAERPRPEILDPQAIVDPAAAVQVWFAGRAWENTAASQDPLSVENEAWMDGLRIKNVGKKGTDVISDFKHHGWQPISYWGRDGWELGNYPYVQVFIKDDQVEGVPTDFLVAEYADGNIRLFNCANTEQRVKFLDKLAFSYWQISGTPNVDGMSMHDLPDSLKGPYLTESDTK